ncbi:peptidase T [Craterilacuibacter sp. RT1T]|uniref:peptidase T n=1 Tax=Craterilacuibacter sp. RT1T TaxID=2942211 RepID=UPI0020BE3AB4|nr:peptidase T [Craterilacuibacter sp. RT1T]MCL6264267.1 peptidase T [Craterilacuibacter sp. RT1T]
MKQALRERFLRYVAISSQSDATATTVPSTPGQLELARLLASELEALGLEDVYIDAHGILSARKPGNQPGAPRIGFVAHLDTVDVGISPDIHPQLVAFDGSDICLNADKDIWLRVAEHPEIAPYAGDEILVSDGTSVLGADDKAAISVVMTLLANLPEVHGDIVVAFVPDEEIGLKGSKLLDLARFPVDFAYTIDCCEQGEVVYETFNAASVEIGIRGITAHPMSAKGVLVNPIRVAHDLIAHFDRTDTPEHTDGRDGYFWVTDMQANPNQATLKMAIRDFDQAAFEARKRYIGEVVALVQARHPRAHIEYQVNDVYANIVQSLGDDRRAIDLIFAGMAELGIAPKVIAMRGGTDGSALSPRGVCTPNYFTGAHNFHSIYEFLPMQSFEKSYALTRRIVELAAKVQA